jgi:urea transport system substrate-binding protein
MGQKGRIAMPDEFSNLGTLRGVSAKPQTGPGETVGQAGASPDETGAPPEYARFLAEPLSPDELGWLAHYRVLKLLGRGGMGMVFEAEDAHLRRMVALKVILPEHAAHPGARERFLREARAGAALKSDHVVTIYQVGQDRDTPFLAMELLQGQTLEDRLAQGGPLPVREALRIGREISAGLAAAHAQGMVHRDVKPSNVWLEAPAGRVKLLDFGLARAAGPKSEATHTGDVLGTPAFMSPEQARGEQVDARSDLFSLGAVLYFLCSGRKPFTGNGVMAVLTALAVNTPRPLQALNPEVPAELEALVGRLLEKDPARRPGSAEEVRAALEAIEAAPRPGGARKAAGLRRRPRWLVPTGLLGAVAVLAAVTLLAGWFAPQPPSAAAPAPAAPGGPPVRIGVLHSRTGTMAISERPVIDAVLLAVEEINEAGGVLGRRIEAVLADGQSDEAVFARQAEKLIVQDKVCTVFGCWTSASRKAVLPVLERHRHLLFYPVQYEGVEQSPHVVYLGPAPNQQILPALRWLIGFENRRRWFLVGSDYVFPVTANALIRAEAEGRGCTVVGEAYLLLGCTDVGPVVERVKKARPDLIVNSINGDTNVAFFRALRRAGVTVPALSTSLSEEELSALGPQAVAGDYVAANYFQSLDGERNRQFVARFARRYGPDRVISSAMQTAYAGVHLWAQAVRAAGRAEAGAIREAVRGQRYEAPQGPVRIDPATLHATQVARVGRVDEAGRLVEVYASPPIAAEPFPGSRTRAQWGAFLDGLHRRWGGRWSNPGP